MKVLFNKSLVLFFIWTYCLGLAANLHGQRNKKEEPSPQNPVAEQVHYRKVMEQALKYGDYAVAINAVYGILVNDPMNLGLKDTLASLYLMSGAYRQAIAVGNEYLTLQPKNAKIIELVALSYSGLGAIKESLTQYEALYRITKAPLHLYQIALQQYQLKRYDEALETLNALIKEPASEKEKVTVRLDNANNQQVNLLAAAHNVKGVVYKEKKEPELARKAFEEAKNIAPEFILPVNNLKELSKETEKR